MGKIETGIILHDNFTNVIYGIISSVNLAVSAVYDMQQAMNTDVDMAASLDGAREDINQATVALYELENAALALDGTKIGVQLSIPQNEKLPEIPSTTTVPVEWKSNSLEVFTGTGIERFQQEVQSANSLLAELNQTQIEIIQTANSMDLLPDDALQDINTLGQRIQDIQQRIHTIENNPLDIGTDVANAELEKLRGQLATAVSEQQRLNQAMQSMDIGDINSAYLQLSGTIGNTERYIRDNTDAQERFNQELKEGASQADGLTNKIKGMVAAYVSIQSVGKILKASDDLISTTARLELMNDGLQSTQELVNMTYAAAQDARGSFADMAGVVARFGNNAKDAFGSSAEVVAFANLVQKQMTIAGASTQEASNAMLQLSQALGSGVLRGDELNSIFEQAPNLIQNIADYLQVPIGEIREMASKGELSANVVKAAIFAASDDINAKFEAMPMTWAQLWQSFQNTALMAFQPVLQRLNEFANSTATQEFIANAVQAMSKLARVALIVLNIFVAIANVVAGAWPIISPIIYGIVGAMLAYNAVVAIHNKLQLLAALATSIHKASLMLHSKATFAATVSQYGFNAALLACPITWIVLAIVILIATLFALCNWIAKTTDVAESGIGVVTGALAVGAAFIGNLLISAINLIIYNFVRLWNFVAMFANFFANVFTDPIGAAARLFFDFIDMALAGLQALASVIDTLFNTSLADAVSGWRTNLDSWVTGKFGEGKVVMEQKNAEDYYFDRINYGDAWDKGSELGDGLAKSINGLTGTEIPNVEDYTSMFADMGDNIEGIYDDTGSISDSMEISEEDLKYLRDIAERESIDRYTTANVKIEQVNHNNISSGMDLDGLLTGLGDAMGEAVEIVTEGAHA